MKQNETITGTVFNIQRFSLHDGPGIRTTVFLKGCNIRCAWCHNPESFSPKPQLSINFSKCTSCGSCVPECPNGAHSITADGKHLYDASRCTLCQKCLLPCPQGAITAIGETMTPEQVMKTVRKDVRYYERSGGGMTVSGGEPSFQFDFLLALLQLAKKEGLHTCVESNGILLPEKMRRLAEYTDLFLLDFKHSDEEAHIRWTGASNKLVYENLALFDELEQPVILRCPVIPSVNDTPAHLSAIHALKEAHPCIQSAEIMPYHDVGVSKWENIGIDYTLSDVKPPEAEVTRRWREEAGI